MTRLPVLSGKDLCKALEKFGYFIDHQTGSHIILRHYLPPYRRAVVPNHKEIAKGTLKAILNQTGITIEELSSLK
ncbi:type II toxin-antitoxin system HicA family toxin [Candidatus Magnetomonas plexicatena]|uniref:type II toxin-antitoxin system HicA family toxin n=1 Tax=Candidatus Magnetomonas plexicatena TaxID=2552947 RepID=UPI00110137DB|nr:addiction module toxin, HicA family [Nitrospirales bacterium LBB_01]